MLNGDVPAESPDQRRLAAIMFTDMVGYCAFSQRDEALALELLEEHRQLARPIFHAFHGTEIKTIGDAFLVEFPSALEAVNCAIEIQRGMAKRNADAPGGRQVQIRIGIHLGDVVHRGGDVFGDGVNIASRIEPLAPPGGICVTLDVERQVRNMAGTRLKKLPQASLKNIAEAMDVFRVVLPWEKQGGARLPDHARSQPSKRAPRWVGWGAVALVLLVLVERAWRNGTMRNTPDSVTRPAGRITALAVKPLDDFSGDAAQAYLSDGMTEALCSALGNISALRVPGRSSVMRYKSGKKTIREMARELDVDAIVEGSVQRSQNTILVTVQLIEASSDRHLWSTNYQRDLGDFFVVQSEVARAIAAEIRVRLKPEDQARLAHVRPANRAAVEACLLGMHHWQQWSEDGFTNAVRYFSKAVEIDPRYAPAHAGMALNHSTAASYFARPKDALMAAKEAAGRAIELDPQLAEGYVALGKVRMLLDWDWAGAGNDLKRALELSPNSSVALDEYQAFLMAQGRFQDGVAALEKALEHEPVAPGLHSDLGVTYYYAGQPEKGIPHLLKALELDSGFFQAHMFLGWCYQFTGRTNEAQAEFQIAAERAPENPWPRSALGFCYGKAGRREDALKVLEELDRMASRRYVSRIAQVFVHVGLGQQKEALDWLERAFEEREVQMVYLKVSPVLAELRGDARFQRMLERVGLSR